jgi:hypothetical protein
MAKDQAKDQVKDQVEQSESKLRQAASEWAGAIRETGETVMESTIAVQDRTAQFAQALVDATFEQMEGQLATTHKLVNKLVSQSVKRRAAFRSLRRELFASSINLVREPVRRYRQELEAVRENAKEQASPTA